MGSQGQKLLTVGVLGFLALLAWKLKLIPEVPINGPINGPNGPIPTFSGSINGVHNIISPDHPGYEESTVLFDIHSGSSSITAWIVDVTTYARLFPRVSPVFHEGIGQSWKFYWQPGIHSYQWPWFTVEGDPHATAEGVITQLH